MKNRHTTFCGAFFYLLFFIIFFEGCNKHHTNNDDFTLSLKTTYQRLCATKLGLDYPPRQEILDLFKQGKDPGRLKTYQSVQVGKKDLLSKLSIDPERTLSFTLDTICTQCEKTDKIEDKEKSFELQQQCLGALTALYFFNKDQQDKAILDRLHKASPNVLTWAFSTFRFEWFYNRPKPNRWIEFSKNIPEEILKQMAKPPGEMQREYIIERFEKNIDDIDKFGIML